MQHTKKYMVVPFVNSMEKPQDTYIQNQDKNMSNVITNTNLSPDTKIKLYSQSLNRFLLKYDPNSIGMTPTLTKLAKIVTEYLENKQDPKIIDNDLKNVIPDDSSSYTLDKTLPSLDLGFLNLNNDDVNLSDIKFNSGFLDESEKFETPEIRHSKKNQEHLYHSATKPSQNTRSNTTATHSEGLQDKKNF
jgi:hypothetical protein